MTLENAYEILYLSVFIGLLLLCAAVLIRSVIGPRVTDRIMSVNMLCTMSISAIAILSRLLKEDYLIDVALIYAMISFLAVLMLSATYIPSDRKGQKDVPHTRFPVDDGRKV